jgi:hypothetical protein
MLSDTPSAADPVVAPSTTPAFQQEAPDLNLKLTHVYGYHSFDARSNVFFTKAVSEHEIVYSAGAVGIVHSLKSNT